ncbi:MAG: glutamine synthetase, partial [Gammaproteobacteria bacterium]|nr:glutamine synthetase [Gammaproteobacteria bacterium]
MNPITMAGAASEFLDRHPGLESIDLLIPDLNGILRGKKIGKSLIEKSFEEGVLLPRSLYGCDIRGDTVEETNLG